MHDTPCAHLRPITLRKGTSTPLKQDTMFDTDLTLKSHYTSTQYDFDLDSGGILHVTAYTFEGAVERVERRQRTSPQIFNGARRRGSSSGFLSAQSRHRGCQLLAHKV
jgi:hypothetical protein